MIPGRSNFDTLNMPDTASISSDMDYFTLTAQPSTKIWREAGLPDTITAPMVFTVLREPLIVAEVTISANWELEWDQAGFAIFVGGSPCGDRQTHPYNQAPCRRWVKAGLEFCSGTLHVSSAAAIAPHGADRALTHLPTTNPLEGQLRSGMQSVRIKIERIGDALWIWYKPGQTSCYTAFRSPAEASSGWQKIREVAGFFWGMDRKDGVWIGCYASRPMQWTPTTTIPRRAEDDRSGLWVEFEDLEII